MPEKKPIEILGVTPADENNQVISMKGGGGAYRKTPCPGCPWKVENDGSFPAEAFRISAHTSYDMANEMFGCHESGPNNPTTCAGSILGMDNNMNLRMKCAMGTLDLDKVSDGGHELHESYYDMAVANGVDPADPILEKCR